MTTSLENERLTRVIGGAPMGRLIRENYWMPFARCEALKPDAAPIRVRLLGTHMVAFRAQDGTLGLMDEHCPHRRASLALARLDGCALRCIYHGWQLDKTGAVIDVPSEGARSAQFAARVKVNRYHVREGGGLAWAFLGKGEPPALPPLPFIDVPARRRWWSRMVVKCNWLQGFEGALDSVHLNWLHTGYSKRPDDPLAASSPRYELAETAYGLRTAAIRHGGANMVHFRVAEFIAPFYALSASRQPFEPNDCSVFISVPIDDETHALYFGFWDEGEQLADVSTYFSSDLDRDNLIAADYSSASLWSQDREAMTLGHFSGLTRSVLHEDAAVQESMGPIVDRAAEQLCGTDLAIVRMREYLLQQLRKQDAGAAIDGALDGYAADGHLPFSYQAPTGSDWRKGGQRKQRCPGHA